MKKKKDRKTKRRSGETDSQDSLFKEQKNAVGAESKTSRDGGRTSQASSGSGSGGSEPGPRSMISSPVSH